MENTERTQRHSIRQRNIRSQMKGWVLCNGFSVERVLYCYTNVMIVRGYAHFIFATVASSGSLHHNHHRSTEWLKVVEKKLLWRAPKSLPLPLHHTASDVWYDVIKLYDHKHHRRRIVTWKMVNNVRFGEIGLVFESWEQGFSKVIFGSLILRFLLKK